VIRNTSDLNELLKTGDAELVSAPITDTLAVSAVLVRRGALVVREGQALPIIGGLTSTYVFGDHHANKYQETLNATFPKVGELSHALYVCGSKGYYNFLRFNFPSLHFLGLMDGEPLSLAVSDGFPATSSECIQQMMPVLSGGRAVKVAHLATGSYDLTNVIIPLRASTAVVAHMSREVILPFALAQWRAKNPDAPPLWPLKLFLRRDGVTTGRRLANQQDVEAHYVSQGYVSVNSGAFSMGEQVVLFSRATHIVGVEGAAMANILFAVNAVEVVMLATPSIDDEDFILQLAKNYRYSFRTIFGEVVEGGTGRNADYRMPLDRL